MIEGREILVLLVLGFVWGLREEGMISKGGR